MKKRLVGLVLFLVFVNITAVCAFSSEDIPALQEELEGREIPEIAGRAFGSQRINLHINTSQEQIIIAIRTTRQRIARVYEDPWEADEVTMNAYTNEATINSIVNSDDPLSEFTAALADGRITYQAVGLFNMFRFSFIHIIINLGNWMGIFQHELPLPEAPEQPPQEPVEEPPKLLYTNWAWVSNVHTLYVYDFETQEETMIVDQYFGALPHWSPDGEKILFSGSDAIGQTSFVRTINPNGTELKRLAIGYEAQWYPNGEKILFKKREQIGQNNFSFHAIDPDGEELSWAARNDDNIEKILVCYGNSPKVSPDSSEVIYYRSPAENNRIAHLYIVNSDGTNERLLAENISYSKFWWSPNSEKIAFARGSAFNWEIYVINADGTNEIEIGPTEEDNLFWSPDSSSILYSKEGQHNNDYLYLAQADGSEEVEVGRIRKLEADWHPDGTKFIYSKDTGILGTLTTVDSEGTELLELGNGRNPLWSTLGSKITYAKIDDFGHGDYDMNLNEIYVANADGTGEELIGDSNNNPLWQPA